MRKKKFENLVTTGKVNRKTAKGSSRGKYLDGLSEWHNQDKNPGFRS